MTKCCNFFLIFALLSFCTGQSGYCSTADVSNQVDDALDVVPAEEIIPDFLSEYLFDMGINVSRIRPALQIYGKQNVFLFESDFQDIKCTILQLSDSRIMILLDDRGYTGGVIITFDTARNTYRALKVSPDCIKEISSALQALLSAAHNCAYNPRPFKCAEDIVDFVTSVYLAFVECSSSQARGSF